MAAPIHNKVSMRTWYVLMERVERLQAVTGWECEEIWGQVEYRRYDQALLLLERAERQAQLDVRL